MKNPFVKEDHSILISSIAIGSLTAGAATYLFLTKSGGVFRKQLSGQLSRFKNTLFGGAPEPDLAKTSEYLHKPHKAPKTDRQALHKHQILHEQHPDHNADM